jgi:anti-sigma-K factor RskA
MKPATPGVADNMCDDDPLALTVSDYVAGRLDILAAREIERRAHDDGRLAASILEAKAVLRRVERRLARRSSGTRALTDSRAASAAPFGGDAVPVAGPFAIRAETVRGFA